MARGISAELQLMIGRLAITRGIVFILFGILALIWPGLTLVTLGILLAIWLLVSGTTGLISSVVSRRRSPHWVFRTFLGVLEIGVGAYLVQRPSISVATLVALVAIILIAQGVIEIVVTFVDRLVINKVFPTIVGILGVVAGILVWRYPVTGGLAFVWVLGVYALLIGALNIAAGVELER
jgi:uncharacterized membrane protein HdeD (DUF308 family)